jgi:hypothetical protein
MEFASPPRKLLLQEKKSPINDQSWKRSFLGGEANSIDDFFSWRRS